MPFLDQLVRFGVILHTLPLKQLRSLRFASDSVQHSSQDNHQSKEAGRGDLMTVQNTRKPDTQQNACRHDESKNNFIEFSEECSTVEVEGMT